MQVDLYNGHKTAVVVVLLFLPERFSCACLCCCLTFRNCVTHAV